MQPATASDTPHEGSWRRTRGIIVVEDSGARGAKQKIKKYESREESLGEKRESTRIL